MMEEATLAPIEQTKLRESVYAALSEAFTRGAFAPGDTMSLREIADQLGTSMTPVREAVRRLVAEGGLIDTPSRKLQVPPFDRERLRDLMRARIALEPMLTRLAVERMDDATVRALEAILAEPSSPDGQPDLEQNHRFHFTLYKRSGSPVVLPVVEGLWLQYGPYLKLMIGRADAGIGRGNDIHHEILDATRTRDAERAAAGIEQDIRRSFNLIPDDPGRASSALRQARRRSGPGAPRQDPLLIQKP
jgi:DNA-binding GntR family transcriptional regulator